MISAFERKEELGCEFEDNLGHIERPCPREGEGAQQKNKYEPHYVFGTRESQFFWCGPVLVAFVGWFHGYCCVTFQWLPRAAVKKMLGGSGGWWW